MLPYEQHDICNAEGEKAETLRQKDQVWMTLWRAKGHRRINFSLYVDEAAYYEGEEYFR